MASFAIVISDRRRRDRVIAFGGQVLGDGEPKYLNTRYAALRQTTYGTIAQAGSTPRREEVIVAEGYMDVIALSRGGFQPPLLRGHGSHRRTYRDALSSSKNRCSLMAIMPGSALPAAAAERALPLLKPGK